MDNLPPFPSLFPPELRLTNERLALILEGLEQLHANLDDRMKFDHSPELAEKVAFCVQTMEAIRGEQARREHMKSHFQEIFNRHKFTLRDVLDDLTPPDIRLGYGFSRVFPNQPDQPPADEESPSDGE